MVIKVNSFKELVNSIEKDSDIRLVDDIVCPTAFAGLFVGQQQLFIGEFDGNGHCIKGLDVRSGKEKRVGFFSGIGEAGVVKNVEIVGARVSGSSNVGVVAGECHGELRNVSIKSSVVEGSKCVGGVVGKLCFDAEVSEVATDQVTVDGDSIVGGLVGKASSGGCIEKATIDHGTVIGGCTKESNRTGGLIGVNLGTIQECEISARLISKGGYMGGVVALNKGTVYAVEFTGGFVGGTDNVGAICGENQTVVYGCEYECEFEERDIIRHDLEENALF